LERTLAACDLPPKPKEVKLKITLMHYSAPPVVGGVERVMAHQAQLLAADGHTVHVIAARGAAWSEAVTFQRVPLIDSLHPEVLAVKTELDRGDVTARFTALRDAIAARLQPLLADSDVLIAHNICSLVKNLALTAALAEIHAQTQQPHFILIHHDLAWATPRYRAELHAGYPWALLRSTWPGATHVVDSHLRRRELAELTGLPAPSIVLAPIGVDLADFYKLDVLTVELLARTELLRAAPILLLPVRLTRRKNIEFALRVLAALRGQMPNAALVVTGPVGAHNPANVQYQAELAALRRELGLDAAAILLAELSDGFLPDAVIADFYRLADALFLPSLEEGFGIPMLEAAFSRLPIFCSAIEPLTELGGNDVVYFDPAGAPTTVAARVADVLAQSPVYQFAARARVTYTWEQVYTQHLAPLLATLPTRKETP
jgi:glycosyltransferase involved in cell wall biosynthesis